MKRRRIFIIVLLLITVSVISVNGLGIDNPLQNKSNFISINKSKSTPSIVFSSVPDLANNLNRLPHYNSKQFRSLMEAIAYLGGKAAVLEIFDEQFVREEMSFPANIHLQFHQTGRFSVEAEKTVLIKGTISAGLGQIFSGKGKVSFIGGVSRQVFPQWWGAKGDGKTDDTRPVQEGINTIAKRGGGEVIFSEGTYVVDSISLDSNVSITGNGWTSILEQKRGAQYCCSINHGNGGTSNPEENKKHIRISNLHFRGTVTSDRFAEHIHLLNINAATDVVVSNCLFSGWRGDGIYLGSSNVAKTERHNRNIIIKNCLFDGVNNDNRNAITVIDCDGLSIDNNSFTRCTRSNMPGAIDMEPDDNQFSVIRNIDITNNKFGEIGGNLGVISLILPVEQNKLISPSSNIRIINNTINCNFGTKRSTGITLKQSQNVSNMTVPNGVTISDNKILKSARPFIILGVKGVNVINNIFEDSSMTGLISYLDGFKCQDVIFKGNVFRELATRDGIGIAVYNVDRIEFTENTFDNIGLPSGVYGAAIDFHNGIVDWVRIENNHFKGKRTTIIVQKEANNINYPEHNTIRNNKFEYSKKVHFPSKQ